MRWQNLRRSSNVEDQRSHPGRRMAGGVGLGGIVVAVIYFLLGGDPKQVIQTLQSTAPDNQPQETVELSDAQRQMGEFVSAVLASTEDVWAELFRREGMQYRMPKLVLFRNGSCWVSLKTSLRVDSTRTSGLLPIRKPHGILKTTLVLM